MTDATAIPIHARKAGLGQVFMLIAITNLPVLGVVSLAPVMPDLLHHFATEPGARYLVPLAMTLPGLCIALLSPLAGAAVDRFGRRRLLIVALALFTVCGMMPLLLDGLYPILATRLGIGMAEAMILTICTALMGDYYNDAERRKWLAVQAACGSLIGSTLFMVSGGLGSFGWRHSFWVYLVAAPILAGAWGVLFEPQRRKVLAAAAHVGVVTPFPAAWMLRVCLGTLACAMVFYAAPLSLSLRLAEVGVSSPARAGMLIGLAGLGMPLGAIMFRRLGQWPRQRLMALVMALTAAGLTTAGTVGQIWLVGAAMFVNQIGCGLMMPALFTWCLSGLDFEHRGKGSGLFTSAFFLGQFLSPMAMTVLADQGRGIGFAFIIAGALCLCGMFALLLQRSRAAALSK